MLCLYLGNCRAIIAAALFLSGVSTSTAFTIISKNRLPSTFKIQPSTRQYLSNNSNNNDDDTSSFNPFHISSDSWMDIEQKQNYITKNSLLNNNNDNKNHIGPMALTAAILTTTWDDAIAAVENNPGASSALAPVMKSTGLSSGAFNPDNFKPVCPTSDTFYRFLQGTTQTLVGEDQFYEYGPLIAGGLLRIRLELCVVESFFNEAVGPFIQQNGLKWVLPLHETVETFLAGTVFALATTFILVGSTKIISVIFTYGDVFIGAPSRLFGGFFFDRARGKPVTLDIGFGPFKKRIVGPEDGIASDKVASDSMEDILESLGNVEAKQLPFVIGFGTIKTFGELSKVLREITESIDTFVGRYLTLIATGYIGLKFIHFKVFPDFPPF